MPFLAGVETPAKLSGEAVFPVKLTLMGKDMALPGSAVSHLKPSPLGSHREL